MTNNKIINQTFIAKGNLYFFYDTDGINYYTNSIDDIMRRYEKTYKNYLKNSYIEKICKQKYTYEDCDIMSGIDFLQDVKNNCFSDYDGYIEHVFVDGYKSNLGLLTDNLQSGDFLVTEDVWEKLCVEHDIQVSWCNK